MTPELPPAALRLRIDEDALADNWRALDRLSGSARAGAAVKADAYGVGVAQAVPVLAAAGARDFFVAHWSECAAVLDLDIDPAAIAVLHGPITPQEAAYGKALGVRPVINSLAQAAHWHAVGGGACHLMVDTGINRLGIAPEHVDDPVIAALQVEVLLSHLACADEESAANARQLEIFRSIAAQHDAPVKSLANSAGITLGKDYAFDMTRPGLSLYGGVPVDALAGQIRPVVHPQAAIIQRRTLKPGDTVGYNALFQAPHAMEAAVVSIGYADGFLRCRGAGAALQHDGQALPILGHVSMDMVVVDAGRAPQLREGDFLDIPFDLPAESARSGLSQYELLTTLGDRFTRQRL